MNNPIFDSPFKSTVVSLVPWHIKEEKPGLIPGIFNIEASDTHEPKTLIIGKSIHYVYLDNDRGSLMADDSPDKVAKSIVMDYVNSQLAVGENCRPALFWLPGEVSVDELLGDTKYKIKLFQERQYQQNWFTALCRIADDDWKRYQQHNVISDFQRKAAELINWDSKQHIWMDPTRAIKNPAKCPACGTSYEEGLVICPNCRCILDADKAKAMQFA